MLSAANFQFLKLLQRRFSSCGRTGLAPPVRALPAAAALAGSRLMIFSQNFRTCTSSCRRFPAVLALRYSLINSAVALSLFSSFARRFRESFSPSISKHVGMASRNRIGRSGSNGFGPSWAWPSHLLSGQCALDSRRFALNHAKKRAGGTVRTTTPCSQFCTASSLKPNCAAKSPCESPGACVWRQRPHPRGHEPRTLHGRHGRNPAPAARPQDTLTRLRHAVSLLSIFRRHMRQDIPQLVPFGLG